MSDNSKSKLKDTKGIATLTADAIIGVSNIAESLHQTINSLGGLLGKPVTSGISGFVYKSIRTKAKLLSRGLDSQFEQLSKLLGEREPSPNREAAISALNGVIGDYLADQNSSLAITMKLRREGKTLTEPEILNAIKQSNGKLVIMIHGLCMNDLQWNRKEHDHGKSLASDFGFLPLYVHYNTGLHISDNGKELSNLLENIIEKASIPVELFIVAHSMGGLVSRSAYHYGEASNSHWVNHLKKIIFLGTPHHGALSAKAANWLDKFLEISPYSAPFASLTKIRSNGITDLRYGNLLREDWEDRNRFELSGDRRKPVPLPNGVSCYTIAATTKKESNKINNVIIGDSLVSIDSALGKHIDSGFNLSFPKSHQWVGTDMNHFDVLSDPSAYSMIKKWLKE